MAPLLGLRRCGVFVMAVITTAMTGPLLNWILGRPKADDPDAPPYLSDPTAEAQTARTAA